MKLRQCRIGILAGGVWLTCFELAFLFQSKPFPNNELRWDSIISSVEEPVWVTEDYSRRRVQKEVGGPNKTNSTALAHVSPGRESTFNWTDVDLTRKGVCGWHKCFFRSVSDKDRGYLVASRKKIWRMKEAIEIALELEKQFDANHFHLDLAEDTISEDFKVFLNSLVDQPARRSNGAEVIDVYDESRVAIETVMMAPEPALFFAETRANLRMIINQLAEFRAQIPDAYAFRWQMKREYEKLERMLKVKPELALDFQSLIDLSGNVYLIDLDGHLSLSLRTNQAECRAKKLLNTFKQVMLNLTDTAKVRINSDFKCD